MCFLRDARRILVLGEEDFSLSYEIASHPGSHHVVGAAYKPNKYENSFATKLREIGGETWFNCDAQRKQTFREQTFDAVVFTFPRLLESMGKEIGNKYFALNQEFFRKWLSNARNHLTPSTGAIYIVLIQNQIREFKLDEVCQDVGLQWRILGEFPYQDCVHYKPKNEEGKEWRPMGPLLFEMTFPEIERPPLRAEPEYHTFYPEAEGRLLHEPSPHVYPEHDIERPPVSERFYGQPPPNVEEFQFQPLPRREPPPRYHERRPLFEQEPSPRLRERMPLFEHEHPPRFRERRPLFEQEHPPLFRERRPLFEGPPPHRRAPIFSHPVEPYDHPPYERPVYFTHIW